MDIEYFYSAHSGFAFLGSRRLTEIADAADVRIVHKPIDLHAVMEAQGISAFASRPLLHRDYYFRREIERWSEHRVVPWLGKRPTHHSNDYTLANLVLVAGLVAGHDIGALAHAMLEGHWRFDADLAEASVLTEMVRSVGLDPDALLEAAATKDVNDRYQAFTAEAISRSVLGSPTYFVDGDMFYGQDHLEMVERALTKPYQGVWPPE